MAQAANPHAEESGGVQRGRGGFYRGYNDTPYVSDPAGGIVKSGPRRGQPKRIPYGSPSGFGKQIENTYNLQKWGERRVVLGLGVHLALIAECAELARMEVDSDEYKAQADRIVVAAKEAAETSLAADRGTHGHAILEDDDEGRDWLTRAEEGALLGIPVDAQLEIVKAWRHMLERDGLEVLVTEASCIDDTWHLAGTLDNIARCTKELRFLKPGGEIATIPAGTVLVLDKKTGQRRTNSAGVIQYWHGYSVQVASYAQSVPYDTEAETRGEWPWPIDQTHALIAHIDILAAIAGAPFDTICNLVYVDLVAGREHGGATVVRAKEWEKRTDVFSVAKLDDAEGITAADEPDPKYCARCQDGGHVCVCGAAIEHGTDTCGASCPGAPPAPDPAKPPTVNDGHEHDWHKVGRCLYCKLCHVRFGAHGTIDTADPPAESTPPEPEPPATAPVAAPSPLRAAQLERAATNAAHATQLPERPDEGADLSADTYASMWEAMGRQFKALSRPALDWLSQLIREARTADVGFQAQAAHTARRSHIYRGIIALAGHEPSDDALRALLRLALDSDAPLFPTITAGHALGSLDADRAERFAELVDAYLSTPPQLVAKFNDDGQFVLDHLEVAA